MIKIRELPLTINLIIIGIYLSLGQYYLIGIQVSLGLFILLVYYINQLIKNRKKQDIISISKRYAIKCHKSVNQKYDGEPYSKHLEMVFDYATKYKHLLLPYDVETTGKHWKGKFIERSGPFHNIDPIPMKGFQGFRYL